MRSFPLFLLILAALIAGCAPKPAVQALENPPATDPPEASSVISERPGTVPQDPPETCPITAPQEPAFIPPSPYDSKGLEGVFWYGSDLLWTAVPQNGTWAGLPQSSSGYTQKVFWWRDGYVWNEEPEPTIRVTGERLDAPAPALAVSGGTNAYASDIGSAMLVGVDFPTLGCWKITGNYGDEKLSFVVWVAP